jgi:hypothetical protein
VFSFPLTDLEDMIDFRTEVEDLLLLCAPPGLDPAVRGLFILQKMKRPKTILCMIMLSGTVEIQRLNSSWTSLGAGCHKWFPWQPPMRKVETSH